MSDEKKKNNIQENASRVILSTQAIPSQDTINHLVSEIAKIIVINKGLGELSKILSEITLLLKNMPEKDSLNSHMVSLKNLIEDTLTNNKITKARFEKYQTILSGLDKYEEAVETVIVSASIDEDKNKIQEYEISDQSWFVDKWPEIDEVDEEHISHEEIKILLVTANDNELKAVLDLLKPLKNQTKILEISIYCESYYIGMYGCFPVAVIKIMIGESGPSIIDGLSAFRPEAIIALGVAFGRDKEVQNFGDVLISSQIIPYEYQRVEEEDFILRSAHPPSDKLLLNRFNNAIRWTFKLPNGDDAKRIIGPILSGDKLIDSAEYKDILFKKAPHAIGGEMEGGDLCLIANRIRTRWIIVKGICDWAEDKNGDSDQLLAAAAAADLVHYILKRKELIKNLENA